VPDSEVLISGSDGDRRDYRVDFSRIQKTLGFSPKWTIEAGIQQVIDAVTSGEIADYRDPQYSNVAFLREQGTMRLFKRDDGWADTLLKEASSGDLPGGVYIHASQG